MKRAFLGRLFFMGLIGVFCFGSLTVWGAKPNDFGFDPGLYRDGHGKVLPYRLLSPETIQSGRRYPLVVFLHGSWENGNDNLRQLIYIGKAFTVPEIRRRFPAYVLAPQCPKGQNWVQEEFYSGTRPMAKNPTEPAKLTMKLMDRLVKNYPIDSKRIYLTGVSSGGAGTWDLIVRYPGRFAAAAPFSGGGDATKVSRIVQLPIWAFHSKLDVVTNVSCTRDMVDALKKAGGHPRYTEYDSPRHDCWTWTFQDPDFFKWLFAQKQR